MKFFDKVERVPEDEVLVFKTRKEVDEELSKENPIFELVRELSQLDKMCFCRIKIKHLKINEAFFNDKEEYISFRIE